MEDIRGVTRSLDYGSFEEPLLTWFIRPETTPKGKCSVKVMRTQPWGTYSWV